MLQRIWCEVLTAAVDVLAGLPGGASADIAGRTFLQNLWDAVTSHLVFYRNLLREQWHSMSPIKYGGLLISIGVFGWYLMRSGPKRV